MDTHPVQGDRGELVAHVREAATHERPRQGRLAGARVAHQEGRAVARRHRARVEEEEVAPQALEPDGQFALEREQELALVVGSKGLPTRALDPEAGTVAADDVLEVGATGPLAALDPAEAVGEERSNSFALEVDANVALEEADLNRVRGLEPQPVLSLEVPGRAAVPILAWAPVRASTPAPVRGHRGGPGFNKGDVQTEDRRHDVDGLREEFPPRVTT